jgi:hypothetical protein
MALRKTSEGASSFLKKRPPQNNNLKFWLDALYVISAAALKGLARGQLGLR